MPTGIWKDAQHCQVLEKCKLKLQRSITSHQSEWSSLKSLQIINDREDVEEKDPSYTVCVIINWCTHVENSKEVSLKIELPYDPTIPHQGIYPEKMIIWKDVCTLVFIAALFTIAKTEKQPKCPSTNEWMKKMWCVYTQNGIFLSQKKKKDTMPLAALWHYHRDYH